LQHGRDRPEQPVALAVEGAVQIPKQIGIGQVELVIDELPFGVFMEIEGSAAEIRKLEKDLPLNGVRAETQTYPQLARKHGKANGPVIEARFQ